MPRIEHYDSGEIVIDGKRYTHDVIVLPDGRVLDWWREEGHYMKLVDVFDLLDEEIEAFVIGTGYSGRMDVDDEVEEAFSKKGVKVYKAVTREAVRLFNELAEKGYKVAGAFHLTC